MNKILLILPPQWIPSSPYLSLAILKAQLESAGYKAKTLDMNIRFYNYALNKKYVSSMSEKASAMLPALEEKYGGFDAPLQETDEVTATNVLKYRTIKEYFENGGKEKAENTVNGIDDALSVYKDHDRFYEPETLFRAKNCVREAFRIISLPYAPTSICYDNYYPNPVYGLEYEGITRQCDEPDVNMFIDFFREEINNINFDEISAVGISVTDLSQLVPAITLSKMIKEFCPGMHVALGGNYITKICESFYDHPEFFGKYADALMTGDGERTITEWAQCIEGKITKENIHAYVYCDNGKVIHTPKAPLLDMDKIAYPDFSDYEFGLYLSPKEDIVFPIQLAKGCYWGKCTFCDFFYGQQCFDIKSVEHAYGEIENAVKKYGASKFTFVDEAVPPLFYNELSKMIKERGLKVNFYSFVRLESEFTEEVLQNMYDAGGSMFMWGYEAQSKRIMKLINKGVDLDNRQNILRIAHKIGIWNHCTFLLGYPTETMEEIQSTIDIIKGKPEIVNSCTPSNFALKEKALMKKNPAAFGIEDCKKNGAFHISYSDIVADGITMLERKNIRHTFQRDFLKETARHLWTLTFYDIDHLFLYTTRYPVDFIKDYRLSFDKDV